MLSALCPIFPEGNGPAELQDNVSITSPTLPSTIVDRLPVPHPLVRAGVCVCVCARTCMSDRARVLNSMHFDVQAHDKTHRNSIPRAQRHENNGGDGAVLTRKDHTRGKTDMDTRGKTDKDTR